MDLKTKTVVLEQECSLHPSFGACDGTSDLMKDCPGSKPSEVSSSMVLNICNIRT